MNVAMAYLHGHYLETLIEQLEQVRTPVKLGWGISSFTIKN